MIQLIRATFLFGSIKVNRLEEGNVLHSLPEMSFASVSLAQSHTRSDWAVPLLSI